MRMQVPGPPAASARAIWPRSLFGHGVHSGIKNTMPSGSGVHAMAARQVAVQPRAWGEGGRGGGRAGAVLLSVAKCALRRGIKSL
jgi:hypothetical protein